MLFLACNSFFSAAKSSRELQTARSFPDPIKFKATVFFCFHLDSGGKWRFYLLRGEWNKFIECVCFLLHAVSRRSLEIPPDHVRLVSATVLVNLMFTSKLCFILETFPSNMYSCIFFGETTKPLYLYWADYKFVIRFISACWLHFLTSYQINYHKTSDMSHGYWICENYELEDGGKEKLSPVWY